MDRKRFTPKTNSTYMLRKLLQWGAALLAVFIIIGIFLIAFSDALKLSSKLSSGQTVEPTSTTISKMARSTAVPTATQTSAPTTEMTMSPLTKATTVPDITPLVVPTHKVSTYAPFIWKEECVRAGADWKVYSSEAGAYIPNSPCEVTVDMMSFVYAPDGLGVVPGGYKAPAAHYRTWVDGFSTDNKGKTICRVDHWNGSAMLFRVFLFDGQSFRARDNGGCYEAESDDQAVEATLYLIQEVNRTIDEGQKLGTLHYNVEFDPSIITGYWLGNKPMEK